LEAPPSYIGDGDDDGEDLEHPPGFVRVYLLELKIRSIP
jgi:hypothetical protein